MLTFTCVLFLYECNLIVFVKEYLLECVNGVGTDYRGTKAQTKTGLTCQRWEAKFPHRPKYSTFTINTRAC